MDMLRNRYVYRAEAGEDGDDTGGGAADEVVDDKAGEQGEQGEQGSKEREIDPAIIAKAERMGWTPKDKFKGDPAKWRPADEFVERGENMLPLVQAQVRRQEREILELRQSMKELGEYHSKTAQREYERALSHLKAQRAEAIKNGDGAAFDEVDEQIQSLRENIRANEQKQPQQQPGMDPTVFNEWLSRNPWANDRKLQAYGLEVANELRENGETATGVQLLDLITKEIKAKFPEKFENPRRNTAPSVEGSAPPRKAGGKSFADMPREAQAACDRMARNGFAGKPKEMAEFKAQYVKNFFEE